MSQMDFLYTCRTLVTEAAMGSCNGSTGQCPGTERPESGFRARGAPGDEVVSGGAPSPSIGRARIDEPAAGAVRENVLYEAPRSERGMGSMACRYTGSLRTC